MIVRDLTKSKSSTRILSPPKAQKLKAGFVILKPGENVGKHKTTKKEELLIILEGEAVVVYESQENQVKEGQVAFIPENIEHDVRNDTDKILKYLYVVARL